MAGPAGARDARGGRAGGRRECARVAVCTARGGTDGDAPPARPAGCGAPGGRRPAGGHAGRDAVRQRLPGSGGVPCFTATSCHFESTVTWLAACQAGLDVCCTRVCRPPAPTCIARTASVRAGMPCVGVGARAARHSSTVQLGHIYVPHNSTSLDKLSPGRGRQVMGCGRAVLAAGRMNTAEMLDVLLPSADSLTLPPLDAFTSPVF